MAEDRFKRLALKIEELRRKDEAALVRRREIIHRRDLAARELHEICRRFAERLNSHVKDDRLELIPPEFPEQQDEDAPVQIMLNVRGRVLLIALEAPTSLVSTDSFRKPYILHGELRFFNQELLDEARVEEHGLYYCPGEGPRDASRAGGRRGSWLFWNGRNYRSGPVDEDYLAAMLEQLM